MAPSLNLLPNLYGARLVVQTASVSFRRGFLLLIYTFLSYVFSYYKNQRLYVTPLSLACYCSETVRAKRVKFSHRIGHVEPFVVSTFRGCRSNGVHVAAASLPHLGPQRAACDKHVLSVHFFADKTVQLCVTDCQLADNGGVGVGFAVIYRDTKVAF